MANPRSPFHRIRLVYRRSSPLLKCVVLSCIVLALVALLVIRGTIQDVRQEREAKRAEAAKKEQENAQLEENISQQGTNEWFEKIARDELGFLPEGSEIITPERD